MDALVIGQRPIMCRLLRLTSLLSVWLALAVLAGCGATGSSPAATSPRLTSAGAFAPLTPALTGAMAARARAALTSFMNAFYVSNGTSAFWRRDTRGGQAVFWTSAEMIEMVEDAYQTSHRAADRQALVALMNGFVAANGSIWTARPYNDDIMWMVIASLRAYRLTGTASYLTLARTNFDLAYARGWSGAFGGGLWWSTAQSQKNTTTNGPAVIAACLLASALHDRSYLRKAEAIFAWQRARLYDPRTGSVYDDMRWDTRGFAETVRWKFTYNQGTFIGGAGLLYKLTGNPQYYRDAIEALQYTQTHLTRNGILHNEGYGKGSEGAFKGIFARWAVGFANDNRITAFDGWFLANANAAWAHRNGRGLIGQDWSRPTGNGLLQSINCSSAVVLLTALG